jgi:spermidine synthase
MTRQDRALFSVLFFMSGAAGLIYEVCWTRLLRLPMGNTVYSMAAVLTAFMGGLALGSWLAGRRIDRGGQPLRIYALLEGAIGVFCLALPWIVAAQTPLFRAAYRGFGDSFLAFQLFKFFACALVILVPATLMGATLPVLCRSFFDDPRRIGRSIGWLYAINALGAVCGSLLAGFVLVPGVGQRATIWIGVAISLTVAAIAWWSQRGALAKARSVAVHADAKPAPAGGRDAKPAPGAARGNANPRPRHRACSSGSRFRARRPARYGSCCSSPTASRASPPWCCRSPGRAVLSLAFGSSVYAFALLVSAFILGLAIGSAVASRIADRLARPALGFAVAELGIGFAALAMVPVLQHYPSWMLHIVPSLAQDFSRFQLAQFGLVFVTLLLPTLCMGACLPLVGRALVRDLDHAAESVGVAYSANAVGTIVGSFAGAFVFLPLLGMHHTILAGAAINLAAGIVLLGMLLPRRRALPVIGLAGAAGVAAIAFVPRFDAASFTSGAYLYADRLAQSIRSSSGGLRGFMESENRILMNREGLAATITVKETNGGVRTLSINGKADASDDLDMATQILTGHLPALLHPAPRDCRGDRAGERRQRSCGGAVPDDPFDRLHRNCPRDAGGLPVFRACQWQGARRSTPAPHPAGRPQPHDAHRPPVRRHRFGAVESMDRRHRQLVHARVPAGLSRPAAPRRRHVSVDPSLRPRRARDSQRHAHVPRGLPRCDAVGVDLRFGLPARRHEGPVCTCAGRISRRTPRCRAWRRI